MSQIPREAHSFRNFTGGLSLTLAEQAAIANLPISRLLLGADREIVSVGDRPSRCATIVSGFASTSKMVSRGKRQFAALHVAGDMPDLMSLHLETMDCDIRTSTACEVEFVNHEDLRALCENHPRLGFAFWQVTLRDAAIMREWVVNLARRPALARLAHFFCEIFLRLDAAGLARNYECDLPLTQEDLSDVTGLSAVHVNRTLQVLRASGFMTFSDGKLIIRDWRKLKNLADFDDLYLHFADRDEGEVARALIS